MALTQAQIDQYTAENRSGFNYTLPDGTVIKTSVNPSEAANVDTVGILLGRTAAPIPNSLLDLARTMYSAPVIPTGVNAAGNYNAEEFLQNYEASRGGFVQDLGGTSENNGAPSPINPTTPNPYPITTQTIQQGVSNITSTGATIPTTVLQPGSTDTASVKALQDYLVKSGYMTQAQVDTGYGIYGPQTTAAVKALQEKLGVDNSTGVGYFGPRTISALQAQNQVTPNTTPGAITATGLVAGAGTAINLGGNLPGTPYNPTAVVAGAEQTSKSIQDYIKMLEGPKSATQTKYDQLLAEVEGLLPQQGGRGAAQAAAEQATGVDILRKRLSEINSQILTKTAEYRALTTDVEGKPITMSSIIGSQAQIQRVMASDIGMLQATALGMQGQLEAAQQAADRAVDLKYADVKDALDIRMSQLELIRGELTKQESIRADAIQMYYQDQQQKLAAQMATEKQLASFNLDAMNSYPSAGIGINDDYATTQRKIVGSTEYKLEVATQQRLNNPTPTVNTSVPGLTPEQQSDPFIQLLLNSSGGKALTDTTIQSLTKGINVLGQVGALEANVKDIETGPITGLFRGLNPWDTNAQTIKAQLNGIVPNLARGIYGEVGVLTDNDIAQYSKTLPNLTSTEDVRNAVLGITLDLIGKSIKNTLEVNAAAGRDVSGFVDVYTNMINTRDSIFSQIPGYGGEGGTKPTSEDVTLFDSVISNTSSDTSGGFFSNIWKGLTGT